MNIVKRALSAAALCSIMVLSMTASAQQWPDMLTPTGASSPNPKDAALIIGVEDYVFVPPVRGARDNAVAWFNYFHQERRVPHLKLLKDQSATRESILDHARRAATAVRPGGTLWVIFIGHGAPSRSGDDGVLVGADAQQNANSLYARSVAKRELLTILGRGRQTQTVVILDTCFSGRGGQGPLVPGLQPLVPVKAEAVEDHQRGVHIFMAGGPDEFAGSLPALGRPAFSYLMLGAMRGWADQNQDGQVTADESFKYTQRAFNLLLVGRSQQPTLQSSEATVILASGREKGPDLASFATGRAPRPGGIRVRRAGRSWNVFDNKCGAILSKPHIQPLNRVAQCGLMFEKLADPASLDDDQASLISRGFSWLASQGDADQKALGARLLKLMGKTRPLELLDRQSNLWDDPN